MWDHVGERVVLRELNARDKGEQGPGEIAQAISLFKEW